VGADGKWAREGGKGEGKAKSSKVKILWNGKSEGGV